MTDYFKPGEIVDIRDTGELCIVTRASAEGIHFRGRAHHTDEWGPERFLPTAGEWVVTSDD